MPLWQKGERTYCSYCGQENEQQVENCLCCEAPLHIKRPKLDGFVYLDLCERPFQTLAAFHTYDLLVLLRLVREKRSDCYHFIRIFQKASEEAVKFQVKRNIVFIQPI